MLGPKDALDICLSCWDRTATYRKYIRSLGSNLEALEGKMVELNGVYDGVNRLVSTDEEGKRWIRTEDVAGWLGRVEALKKQVHEIVEKGNEVIGRSCLCGICFKNCRSRYAQSKLAEDTKTTVEYELNQGQDICDGGRVAYEPGDLILETSLQALHHQHGELQGVYNDVKGRVEMEEKEHRVRTHEVGLWLERVTLLLDKDVPELLEQARKEIDKSCHGTDQDSQSQRNRPSYHLLSKHAEDKTSALKEELAKGHGFSIYTGRPDDPLMVEIPLEKPVGIDSNFEKVWEWVQDENVRCIGLYGMGGVGKTTLLKKIHNEFLHVEHRYDFVAWIVVSRPTNREKIQEVIWMSLKLPESEWVCTSETDRGRMIFNIMKKKSFLLFLDDIWEEIDLLNLGIPSRSQQYKSKIIFTTRSEEVCGLMQAERMEKVHCLPPDEALKLFRGKVGEETWSAHVEIPELAKVLVEECDYLPLALITVGATMSSRKHPDDWRRTIEVFKNGPSNFKGMEKVLSVLEVSFEALPDETLKQCFLYCSIFPEDYEFGMEELIDKWIGEGFLDKCGDYHEARASGIDIINSLIRACLLETSTSVPQTEEMRMHDVVRDMALWVASGHGKEKHKVLVQDSHRSFEPKEVKKWNDAEKVSLWNVVGKIHNFPPTLSCSRLSTLILRNAQVETFPLGFFSSMPSLRVLDLSGNHKLRGLPEDFGVLVNLRYLNLCGTDVGELALVDMKNLQELVVLFVPTKCHVPAGLISSLASLRVFSWNSVLLHCEEMTIDDARIELTSATDIEKLFMSSHWLQRCLGQLWIFGSNNLSSLVIPKPAMSRMEHTRYLGISECNLVEVRIEDGGYGSGERRDRSPPYEPILQPSSLENQHSFCSLKEIEIMHCDQLQDVTVLLYHAPSLTRLFIQYCPSMRELIAGDVDDSHVNRIFPRLSKLELADLPSLESICRRALPFPSLSYMKVYGCWKMKKLPLDGSSGSQAKPLRIEGDLEWWEELEWDDQETKRLFSNKFVQRNYEI